ncbi:uncharacterized protein K452DRAFT_39352 [Aplosporella prunicola CBS 121167]|uniref:Uncharacterized protein n=1 Tax=Aplosporella prunicola CBS 121167 TaxID=1176127 RepID=A0A6A6BBK1_9PEZI|nr:uncharacterized protein K452DRAFT_39352 [Aplosporella prunicola CBS 121167]KAF2141426.1 hypothetical protein K452DRAFT_39352 [Aplosporella prunicola CBS 121167]
MVQATQGDNVSKTSRVAGREWLLRRHQQAWVECGRTRCPVPTTARVPRHCVAHPGAQNRWSANFNSLSCCPTCFFTSRPHFTLFSLSVLPNYCACCLSPATRCPY